MLSAGLIISGSLLTFLVYRFDPTRHWLIPLAFYVIFFALCFSITALAGFLARRFVGKREFLADQLRVSLRQGVWFSILLISLLLLKAAGLFNLISIALLLLAMVFLESYFLFSKTEINR